MKYRQWKPPVTAQCLVVASRWCTNVLILLLSYSIRKKQACKKNYSNSFETPLKTIPMPEATLYLLRLAFTYLQKLLLLPSVTVLLAICHAPSPCFHATPTSSPCFSWHPSHPAAYTSYCFSFSCPQLSHAVQLQAFHTLLYGKLSNGLNSLEWFFYIYSYIIQCKSLENKNVLSPKQLPQNRHSK